MTGVARSEARLPATVVWRRLDTPGHDCCRVQLVDGGFLLEGMAVFVEHGAPSQLAYRLECDTGWRSRSGQIRGWVGDRRIDLSMDRSAAGQWVVNGAVVAGLDHLVDLDYGFTPATNFPQLQRINLAVGEAADVPVAWIDATADTLTLLRQRYERRSPLEYWYESPTASYRAMLQVLPSGLVRVYPTLWEIESSR